jgi:phosphotransferase system  glucose/maltose/N-acetylglucosamine-specific IIC component
MKNIIKRYIKRYILAFIVAFLVTYLIAYFVELKWNPLEMNMGARMFMSIIPTLIAIVAAIKD